MRHAGGRLLVGAYPYYIPAVGGSFSNVDGNNREQTGSDGWIAG
jgi:hypothetical protein